MDARRHFSPPWWSTTKTIPQCGHGTCGMSILIRAAVRPRMLCYCDATQKKFREWLKAKYGTLENLGKAGTATATPSWDNVHPPRNFGGYPESLDWLEFRIDNQFRLYKWRVDLVRKLDQQEQGDGARRSVDAGSAAEFDEQRMAIGR